MQHDRGPASVLEQWVHSFEGSCRASRGFCLELRIQLKLTVQSPRCMCIKLIMSVGRGSLGRVLLLQVSSNLVLYTFARVIPSCSFTFARVIPTLFKLFVKTFLVYLLHIGTLLGGNEQSSDAQLALSE